MCVCVCVCVFLGAWIIIGFASAVAIILVLLLVIVGLVICVLKGKCKSVKLLGNKQKLLAKMNARNHDFGICQSWFLQFALTMVITCFSDNCCMS